jgi:hypothetical protein
VLVQIVSVTKEETAMPRHSPVLMTLVLVLAGCSGVASTIPGEASPAAGATAPMLVSHGNGPFRTEWERTGPTRIGGRIYNDYQDGASALQLLVLGLDASNRVVNQRYLWIGGEIGPLDSRSFMLTKLPPADHYWVTVYSYQIQERPGCCPTPSHR